MKAFFLSTATRLFSLHIVTIARRFGFVMIVEIVRTVLDAAICATKNITYSTKDILRRNISKS